MKLLKELVLGTVNIIRNVEPSFLTEETSLELQKKDADAAHALHEVGTAIYRGATDPLVQIDTKIREETPARQLKQPIHSRYERILIALNSLKKK